MGPTSVLTRGTICIGVLDAYAGTPGLLLLALIVLLAAGCFIHWFVNLPKQAQDAVLKLIRSLRSR